MSSDHLQYAVEIIYGRYLTLLNYEGIFNTPEEQAAHSLELHQAGEAYDAVIELRDATQSYQVSEIAAVLHNIHRHRRRYHSNTRSLDMSNSSTSRHTRSRRTKSHSYITRSLDTSNSTSTSSTKLQSNTRTAAPCLYIRLRYVDSNH